MSTRARLDGLEKDIEAVMLSIDILTKRLDKFEREQRRLLSNQSDKAMVQGQ